MAAQASSLSVPRAHLLQRHGPDGGNGERVGVDEGLLGVGHRHSCLRGREIGRGGAGRRKKEGLRQGNSQLRVLAVRQGKAASEGREPQAFAETRARTRRSHAPPATVHAQYFVQWRKPSTANPCRGRKKRTEKRWRSPVPPAHCLTVPRGPDCSALFSSAATFILPSTRGVCKGALRHRGRGGRTSAERRYTREDRQGGLWSSARFACGAVASSSPQECLHGFFFVSSDLHAPLRSVAASPTAAWVPVRPTAADRTLAARREAGARPATGATRATEAVADMQAILIRGWGQRGCVEALGAKGKMVVSFRQMGIICFGSWEFYLKNEGSFHDCLVLSWSDVVG